MEFVHKSVLFDEAIKALDLNENKIIVDGTAGGGGHSGEIAKRAKRVLLSTKTLTQSQFLTNAWVIRKT